MKREVEYKWRLAELMAARGLHNTTDLIPLLAERGIALSRPQVYGWSTRNRNGWHCRSSQRSATSSPADPRTSSPSPPPTSAPATGTNSPNVVDLNRTVRPRRARVIDDDN